MMLGRYKYVIHTCKSVSFDLLCNNQFCSVIITYPKENKSLKNSTFPKILSLFLSIKMTTRSQKRKAVAELVSGDFETSVTENFPPETLVASSSKIPRIEPESLAEIKTSLRKEIMSDLTKILAENQKEMLKLIAPLNKKQNVLINAQDSDSETENVSVARTSTPVKTHNTTNSKTTPVNSRNTIYRIRMGALVTSKSWKKIVYRCQIWLFLWDELYWY